MKVTISCSPKTTWYHGTTEEYLRRGNFPFCRFTESYSRLAVERKVKNGGKKALGDTVIQTIISCMWLHVTSHRVPAWLCLLIWRCHVIFIFEGIWWISNKNTYIWLNSLISVWQRHFQRTVAWFKVTMCSDAAQVNGDVSHWSAVTWLVSGSQSNTYDVQFCTSMCESAYWTSCLINFLFQIAEAYSLKEDCILSSAQPPHFFLFLCIVTFA